MKMSGRGATIAAAAALLFSATASATDPADDTRIKCFGVNSCKHTSACATANNSCAGQNKCRGRGFVMLTQADCDAAKDKAGQK